MERITNGTHQELRFDSLDDLIDHAKQGVEEATKQGYGHKFVGRDRWAGGSMEEVYALAEHGWEDGLTDAMPIAEDALELVDADIETIELTPQWDVTGGEVDVGRYVQGIPENMIEYELTPTSNVGRVITLCASSSYSGALTADSVMKRGAAITALALALERTGHETELWADVTISSARSNAKRTCAIRVLVKGVNDVVDPERIAYAFAHPSLLRRLTFAVEHLLHKPWRKALGIGTNYGMPTNPVEDMPDGTIYMPALRTARDIPAADKFIIDTLTSLGLAA